MADKTLNLNQQLALLPATIPDSVVDFLEDFNYGTALQTEGARTAFDPEYLKNAEGDLKAKLEALRAAGGKLVQVDVSAAPREIPGGYYVQLKFENNARGLGLITKVKERTILRVLFQEGDYDEAKLKELLQNPK